MSDEARAMTIAPGHREDSPAESSKMLLVVVALAAALIALTYASLFQRMYVNWNAPASYYSHGFLIPPISLYLMWRNRKAFFEAPQGSSPLGYPLFLMACLMLVVGAFLGFTIVGQLSFLPMLFGVFLLLFGVERTKVMWFPLAFFIMMIPLPGSITQGLTFNLKLLAADVAVRMTNLIGLPLVRDGSYIFWEGDSLVVGDVCGGLRSLIALLAIGALMAYFSNTRPWARWLVLFLSAPIAIVANIVRIFLLCVVGYYKGSAYAAGEFHDISGVFIFAVAFLLFFTLEGILRKVAPESKEQPA